MKYIVKSILVLLALFTVVSCENDFLDVNENDPNRPKSAELGKMLTFSQQMLGTSMSTGNFISRDLSAVMHYLVSRETPTYSMGPGNNGIHNSWNYIFIYVLPNLNDIIKNAEEQDNLIYAGIAKVLKAYVYTILVDLWGDVAYEEAGHMTENMAPAVQSGKLIYNEMFNLLDDAIDNINDTNSKNFEKPKLDDIFYGVNNSTPNTAPWVRLANTLKLKMLLQTRLVKGDITDWSTKLSTLITANNFMKSGEDFDFWYTGSKSPTEERHPVFVSQYPSGQKTYYISPYFYEVLRGQTYNFPDNPFSGIVDPRAKHFIIKQAGPNTKATSLFDYRSDDGFISIFFGTSGGGSSQDNVMALPGLYPIGGKYDNDAGSPVSNSTGNGKAPVRLLSYHNTWFMLAELALVGDIAGDARTYLQNGIQASVAHVNTVSTKSSGSSANDISVANRDALVNAVLAKYDAAADNEKKLEIIITQKWIANFFAPIEPYADYRRTGYPKLFDPNQTGGLAYSPIKNKDGEPGVPAPGPEQISVSNSYKFLKSLYYQANEVSRNPNITQKDPTTFKVFWDTRTYDF